MPIKKEYLWAIGFGVGLLLGIGLLAGGAAIKVNEDTDKATKDKKRGLMIAGGVIGGISLLGVAYSIYAARKSGQVLDVQYGIAKQIYDKYQADDEVGVDSLCDEMISHMNANVQGEYGKSKEHQFGRDFCHSKVADVLGPQFRIMPKKKV